MKKERIIQVAKELFVDKGYSATSIREISQEAQVNLASINYYFSNKQGLYMACLEQFAEESFSFCRPTLVMTRNSSDFKKALQQFTHEMFRVFSENSSIVKLVLSEMEKRDIIGANSVEDCFLTIAEDFKNFLKHYQKENLINPELDPNILNSIYFGHMVFALQFDKQRYEKDGESIINDPNYTKKYADHVFETFYRGIVN